MKPIKSNKILKYVFSNGKTQIYGILHLNPDGTISNYENNNEKFWKSQNDTLIFYNSKKEISSVFKKLGENYITDNKFHTLTPYHEVFPFTQDVQQYKTDKFLHALLPLYEDRFKFIRNDNIKLLEIGCLSGESIKYFLNYFKNGHIYGIDANQVILESDRFTFNIANQKNIEQLKAIAEKIGILDVVIDDGAHAYYETKNTFDAFWPKIKSGGLYIIEDWDYMTDLITDIIKSRGELGGGLRNSRGLSNIDLGIQHLEVSTNDNRAYAIFKKR